MPKSAVYTLAWFEEDQAYELYDGRGTHERDIVAENSTWLRWLSQVSSFAFRGQHGSYTARKEHRPHGEGYWYAYARVEGRLTKRYLGRDRALTFARLEQVARELWFDPQAVLGGKEERVSSAISDASTIPLLATKLIAPRPRPHVVHRPRLIQQLQQGMERALILISAPAGFGKSTLLADWVASQAVPAAWLSLEPQDNDPRRFLSYLLAALQTYDPRLGRTAQALLHPLQSPSLENVLTVLINDLQVWRTGEQDHVVLVLDDYHVITAEPIHRALAFLLDYLPPRLHLGLSTRQDPPLPLARLRGRDALLELRAADLQFTPEETTTFFVEMMGLPLSAEQSVLLHARTEGWITALHLAALSLQGHDDQAGFIRAFTGGHHYIVDYLLEEVLSRQSQEVQAFLLQTSILDRLSGPLCDAVREQGESQALLDSLERANLFLVALDEERQWYRYHRLFAQVLRQRLQQTTPTLVPHLHQRASRWYEQHGFFVEAVSQALAAPAFEETARLIEQHIGTFILQSRIQTLCGWLRALPESLVLARPSLNLIQAIALMYTNQLESASAHLQMVERELDLREGTQDVQRHSLQGQLAACRSLLAHLSGDLERSVVLAQQALDLLPETEAAPLSRLLRAGAMLGAAHAFLVSGDVTEASERQLAAMLALARTSPEHRVLLMRGLNLFARLQGLQGRLHQAVVTYEEIVQSVPRPEELSVLDDGATYSFGLGELLREWNELEAAEHRLMQGVSLVRGKHVVDANEILLGYATLARLEMARGAYGQAMATLDAFHQLAQQRYLAPVLLAQCAALQARLHLAQGNLPAARRWLDSSGLASTDALSYPLEQAYLTMARIRIAEERINPTESGLSEVLFLLERLRAEAQVSGRMRSVLEVLLLLALALQMRGDRTGALATLGQALTLAEPEGYMRLFLDEGPPMLSLLREVQRQGIAAEYIAKLLAAWNGLSTTEAHHTKSLLALLTARERDVLELVLEGASNREIARRLTLSVNTVKKHVLNVCRKLNVQSRAQAIAKVRTLRLL